MGKKWKTAGFLLGIAVVLLGGCDGSGSAADEAEIGSICAEGEPGVDNAADNETETDIEDAVVPTDDAVNAPSEDSQQKVVGEAEDDQEEEFFTVKLPELPMTGEVLADFVPGGWTLLDSVELDFNEDGITDYVGVLENAEDSWSPRILFAVASQEAGGYWLDFQNENLIRHSNQGGVYGDPHIPLTAEENCFTIHSYGGSAEKYSEVHTYRYREGTWYLVLFEYRELDRAYPIIHIKDDWDSGIGIRERNSSSDDMVWDWTEEEPEFDLAYELILDEPPTLEQTSGQLERETDWTVLTVEFAADVALDEDSLKESKSMGVRYWDENSVLYTFENSGKYYLARYCFSDQTLSVLAESENMLDEQVYYKEKIYYCEKITENITYRAWEEEEEKIIEEEETVGIRLNRMDMDGAGKEIVFEYRYPGTDQEIMEDNLPYLGLIYEISGDEIVAEVYIGGEPHPIYRMNTDGSELRLIGQILK